jgi:tRNA(Ile)-lysidine synthase
MSRLARRVLEAIHDGELWGAGDRVAVAVSGGADSVALARLLAELIPGQPWSLAGLIHVHHGLRGAEADADAAFCRALANALSLPFDVTRVDVRAAMAASRRSLESTARTLRYEAFEAAAVRLGATVVATAHTADDQAETVLLRLLRGASLRGVGAIRRRRGRYVRPLLGVRRSDLRTYLESHAQAWREDASNRDVSMPRNRLRHTLLPIVERDWPGAVRALARFARLAADDDRFLALMADKASSEVIRTGADGVELISERVVSLAGPIARRVVRQAIEAAGGTATLADIERVSRLAAASPGRRLDLHGVSAIRTQDCVRLSRPGPVSVPFEGELRLEIPGEVRIGETGAVLRASFVRGAERPTLSTGWDELATLQDSAVCRPLTVRARRPGDRMTPLGSPGSRSLQDLFVDRKLPRAWRSRWPVVVDAEGQIVWVPGLAVSEPCRVRRPEAGMVILEFKKGTP